MKKQKEFSYVPSSRQVNEEEAKKARKKVIEFLVRKAIEKRG